MTSYQDISSVQADFLEFLNEVGLTPADLNGVEVEWTKRSDSDPYVSAPSDVAGVGVFVTQDFSPEDTVASLMVDGVWTEAGRFANHHPSPTARPVRDGSTIKAVALSALPRGTELLLNYRDMRAVLYEG